MNNTVISLLYIAVGAAGTVYGIASMKQAEVERKTIKAMIEKLRELQGVPPKAEPEAYRPD